MDLFSRIDSYVTRFTFPVAFYFGAGKCCSVMKLCLQLNFLRGQ